MEKRNVREEKNKGCARVRKEKEGQEREVWDCEGGWESDRKEREIWGAENGGKGTVNAGEGITLQMKGGKGEVEARGR